MTADRPVVIVGAGLAGLACAKALHSRGMPVLVFERSNCTGGRVRTAEVDGFLLDRGFQVLLTAYPTAQAEFDYEALALRRFYPGALVQIGSRRYRFADPWRKPLAALGALAAPVATLADGWRIARMRASILRKRSVHSPRGAQSTSEYLQARGLSPRVIDRFFRPFFGGVFLDRQLATPSWFFEFVFDMFSRGHAAVPERGMGELAAQMTHSVPAASVQVNTPVTEVGEGIVRTADGQAVSAGAVVIATDASAARQFLPELPAVQWNGTTTLYYDAPRSPVREAILVLNGNGEGLVNHICVPSELSSTVAPPGRALVSVSVVGIPELDDAALDAQVRAELTTWFDAEVSTWRHLQTYRIRDALPRTSARPPSSASARHRGLFVCGDHCSDPSIDGALRSGRAAADLVLSSLAQ